MSVSIKAQSINQRVGRNASVGVVCKKNSFVNRMVKTIGTSAVIVSMVSATAFAAKLDKDEYIKVIDFAESARQHKIVHANEQVQAAYRAKLDELRASQAQAAQARLERNPQLKHDVDVRKNNPEFFKEMAKVHGYAAYARAQQGQPGFEECAFPRNFLGCDGKFAKNKYILREIEMERQQEKMFIKQYENPDFAKWTNSYPKRPQ